MMLKAKVWDEFQSTVKKEFDVFIEFMSDKVEKQVRESVQGIMGLFDDPDKWQKEVGERESVC